MKKKRIILALLLAFCVIFSGITLTSCTRSLDKYWDARLEGGVVRIYGLTKEGKKQETLFLPEYIAGYKVRWLENKVAYPATVPSTPEFGPNVKSIVIEGSVTIGQNFFGKGRVIEFLNSEPPTLKPRFATGDNIYIIPDGSPENYLHIEGGSGYLLSFYKSETIDGYLIKDNVYMGYCGKEHDLIIPEGVTKLHTSDIWHQIVLSSDSIKIPSTVMYIQKDNMINNYPGTIYISKNTIIEDGAFLQKAPIRY
jgi:hypothetical protein